MRLKECVKQSEQELQGVRAELAEREHLLQGAAARHEQLNTDWAQDIHTECVCLQELLSQNGFTVDNKHLSRRYTETPGKHTHTHAHTPTHPFSHFLFRLLIILSISEFKYKKSQNILNFTVKNSEQNLKEKTKRRKGAVFFLVWF